MKLDKIWDVWLLIQPGQSFPVQESKGTEVLWAPIFLLLQVTVVLFTLIPSLFAEIHAPSLTKTALWRQNLSLFEP